MNNIVKNNIYLKINNLYSNLKENLSEWDLLFFEKILDFQNLKIKSDDAVANEIGKLNNESPLKIKREWKLCCDWLKESTLSLYLLCEIFICYKLLANSRPFIYLDDFFKLNDNSVFQHKCLTVLSIYSALQENLTNILVDFDSGVMYDKRLTSTSNIVEQLISRLGTCCEPSITNKMSPFEKRLFLSNYRKLNGVYILNKFNKSEVVLDLIEKNFSNGYGISNQNDFDKLNKIFKRLFNTNFPFNQREIWSYLDRSNFWNIDRGIYKKIDSNLSIPKNIYSEILTIISNEKTKTYYGVLFKKFEKELLKIGINNRYFFKSVLDRQLPKNIITRRDFLIKDITKIDANPISDFIEKSNKPVSLTQIKKAFSGLKETMILQRISANSDILSLENSSFYHVKWVNTDKDDVNEIKKLISSAIDSSNFKTISTRSFHPWLVSNKPELSKKMGFFNNSFGLFSLCKYWFEDDFNFSRPFISDKKIKNMTISKLAYNLVKNEKIFTFKLLDELLRPYKTIITNSKMSFIRNEDDALLIDKDTFLNLSVESIKNVDQIKNWISNFLKMQGKLESSKFELYFMIPKNEYINWNKQTLFAFVYKFCKNEIFIDEENSNYDTLSYTLYMKG